MQKKPNDVEMNSPDSEEDEHSNKDQQMDSDDEGNSNEIESKEKPEKKKKRGIIYISSIPKYMNVTILREMLSEYAKIGRIFLQPGKLSGEPIDKFQTELCAEFLICLFDILRRGSKSKKEKASIGPALHRRLGRIREQTGGQTCCTDA